MTFSEDKHLNMVERPIQGSARLPPGLSNDVGGKQIEMVLGVSVVLLLSDIARLWRLTYRGHHYNNRI